MTLSYKKKWVTTTNTFSQCRTAELTRVTTIENKIFIKEKYKIGKIASGAEYRIDEKFRNFLIVKILIIFQIKKKI